MTALRRDLLGRRLWPVVVLVLVAIVAVPLVMRNGARADVAPVPPAPPLAGAATPAKHTPARRTVSPLPLRDPFASGIASANTKPAATPATASVTAPSSATPTATTSPGVVSPTPTSSSSSPATTTTTTTTTTTVASPPVTPTHQAWTVYRVDLRVGTGSFARLRSDVARLTPLPSVAEPKAMFMGVMAGGKKAVFALGAGVQHSGPGRCRPDREWCAAIVLRAGETEQIISPAAGRPRELNISVVHIASHVTHSRDEALAAFQWHSAAGLCELDLGDPVTYSQDVGTVSARAARTCKGHKAAVPFPGGLAAP